MSSFKPMSKLTQLNQKKKEKTNCFGERPNKGNFGKSPSKPMKKSIIKKKPIANKEEKDYLTHLHLQTHYKCFNCGVLAEEWHHVKLHSSDRKDHTRLIPICRCCHTGNTTFSVHGTPRKWREKYTMEEQYKVADSIFEDYLKTK